MNSKTGLSVDRRPEEDNSRLAQLVNDAMSGVATDDTVFEQTTQLDQRTAVERIIAAHEARINSHATLLVALVGLIGILTVIIPRLFT